MDRQKNQTILTEANFQREVLLNPKPVLVEVYADWCGTCHIIAPVIEKLADLYYGQVKFAIMNFDNNSRMIKEYGITKLPLFLFFGKGELIDQMVGAVSRKELEKGIKTLLQRQDFDRHK